ncbi:MAG: hydroxymethylbilane synthase [Armatimonadota bacterium]
MERIVFGTRGSALALAQTRCVIAAVRRIRPDLNLEERIIRTAGDRLADAPLAVVGGVGLFTGELERALLSGEVDVAVHSMKDLPTTSSEPLVIAAVPPREDPRDALVLPRSSKHTAEEVSEPPSGNFDIQAGLASLSKLLVREGAVVGTSSPRRRAQLRHLRPDLQFRDIRGNVDTRLRKVDSGEYDACVLASAGLRRLGLAERAALPLSPEVCLPAPGQGALAVQCLASRSELVSLLESLNDVRAAAETTAERAVLRGLGSGCRVPVGALARVVDGVLILQVCLADPLGERLVRVSVEGDISDPALVGARAVELLFKRGGEEILRSLTQHLP